MKSIDVKKIGTLAASTLMLGAALAGPVSAGADMTGVDKGFFYDANFNPIVQIVVGEKGMATDAVAAGNIAATIGNLAYMSKTESFTPEYTPEGQVIIETAAIGATGDYVQDEYPNLKDGATLDPENITEFYDKDEGFHFDGMKTYERGDFTQYALACEQQTRTEAGILMEGTYNNIHCLFCMTLCVEGLKNPSHEMKEIIEVNASMIRYYEEGLNDDDTEALKMAIEGDAIKYTVETGYIPVSDMKLGTEEFADFEYRGKIIFMGKEYYVKNIEGDKIYLADGKVLDDITSEGYTSEFNGYKFKIDHLIYSGEYEVAGILLDVEKPDGTIVQVQISKMANGIVDDLEVAGVYAEAAGAVETASIIVYDTASQIVLEDGEDLELGGVEYDGWRVEWKDYAKPCNETTDCDIDEYLTDDVNAKEFKVIEKIDVTLTDDVKGINALEVDESLNFPSQFLMTFKGYMTGSYRDALCSGEGEGNILLERGSDVYQMLISFTGDDGNRYDEVRLDEGPFQKGDTFVLDGTVWEYAKYKKDAGATDAQDTVDVTRKPLISGSKERITLTRVCDPDNDLTVNATGWTNCTVGDTTCNCDTLSDVEIRKIALVDAMDDDDPSKYERDDNVTLTPEDLYWNDDSQGLYGGVLWFDESSNTIVYSNNTADTWLTIDPNMVGTIRDFEMDNVLEMSVVRECNFTGDVDADEEYDWTCDWNFDGNNATGFKGGNDDDLLVIFKSHDEADEYTVIDLTDRGYDEGHIWKYSNGIGLYADFGTTSTQSNEDNKIVYVDEDVDTLLIAPFSGDEYSIDWGVDNKIDSVTLCHPQKNVDATYFLGIGEEATYVEDIITKDDEGKEITAGCCTFKVKEFSVTVAGAEDQEYTTATVNKIIGHLVVPEVSADTSKNLIIVGGAAVNGMCTVTEEDVAEQADKFIVKKDGNLLIVAGYEYEETLAAGDALIDWLNENVHA